MIFPCHLPDNQAKIVYDTEILLQESAEPEQPSQFGLEDLDDAESL